MTDKIMMYKVNNEELSHYGVKGMRKGRRRWTNEDGTLTEAGKQRYGIKGAASSTNSVNGVSGGAASANYRTSVRGVVASTNSRAGIGGRASSITSRAGAQGAISSAGSRMSVRGGISSINSREGVRKAVSSVKPRESIRGGVNYISSRGGIGKAVSSAKAKSKIDIRKTVSSIAPKTGTRKHINDFLTKFRASSVKASPRKTGRIMHSDDSDELMHYRTPGSKNGIRRFQYTDGSLTPEGRIHYGVGPARDGSPGPKAFLSKAGSGAKKISLKSGSAIKKLGSKTTKKIKEIREDNEGRHLAKKAKHGGYKKMGDKDLNKVLNRLNLEKKYRDFRRDEPSGKAKAMAFDLFKNTLNKVVPNITNYKVQTIANRKESERKEKENLLKTINKDHTSKNTKTTSGGGGKASKKPPKN